MLIPKLNVSVCVRTHASEPSLAARPHLAENKEGVPAVMLEAHWGRSSLQCNLQLKDCKMRDDSRPEPVDPSEEVKPHHVSDSLVYSHWCCRIFFFLFLFNVHVLLMQAGIVVLPRETD